MSPQPFALHARHLWLGLRNGGQWRAIGLGVGAALLGIALAWRYAALPLDFMLGMAAALLFIGLWWAQVEGLLQQNRPMLARLVPGHAAALRRSLLVQWALHTGVWTLLLHARMGPDASWALTALLIGTGLVVLAWLVHQPLLWLPLSLLFFGGLSQWRGMKPSVLSGWESVQAQFADPALALACLAIAAMLLGALLRPLIGTGHGAHREHAERRERQKAVGRAMQSGCGVPVKHQSSALRWLYRFISAPWTALLARQLRPGVPAASMGRLNLLLAGHSHWARYVGMGALIVLGVVLPLVVLLAWLPAKGGKSAFDAMRFGLCMGVFSVGLGPLMQLPVALISHRREQGLLMLAPGVPQGRALRDAWWDYQLRQFLIGWGLCTALCMGLTWALGGPSALRYVAGCAAGCLCLCPLVWRDWSRIRTEGPWLRNAQWSNLAVLGVGSLSGAMAEYLAAPPAWSLLTGVVLAFGAGAWARARHQRGAPSASPFPVGRWA